MKARPHDNCYWVIPGRLMAGEYPITIWKKDGHEKLSAIIAAGISHFIDLTDWQDSPECYEGLLRKMASPSDLIPGYDRFVIPDMGVPESPHLTNVILDRIDWVISENRVPYIHCLGGIGRTGTIVGCWLVRQGQSGEEALATIAGHWTTVAKRNRYPESPQTEAQCEYVLRWAEQDRIRKVGG